MTAAISQSASLPEDTAAAEILTCRHRELDHAVQWFNCTEDPQAQIARLRYLQEVIERLTHAIQAAPTKV